ncbi:hypothetical protein JIP4600_290002 [Tenacibaculum maritimum]|nr:hypothetical protein JIP4600_290002 [Tenacibaculum maritimum]
MPLYFLKTTLQKKSLNNHNPYLIHNTFYRQYTRASPKKETQKRLTK